jgi:hydrogenase nickel incorporation protein HypA/HybF
MHEMSIALSLVEVACEEALHRQLERVRALHVRVGARSGVVKEALLFSFDLAASGTRIEGAILNVEDTPGAELELFALEVTE